MLFYRLILAAMLVGAISGLAYSAVQLVQVVPIIQEAELYEDPGAAPVVLAARKAGTPVDAGAAHTAHDHDHDHAGHADHAAGHHGHDQGGWGPKDGIERTTFTVLTNVLMSISLALVLLPLLVGLTSPSALANIGWQHGLLWGAAGYLAFYIAPALGVPPQIPGTAAAPLDDRQMWWILAVACTGLALAGAAFIKSPLRWAALLLIAVPYLVGAPHLDNGASLFPQHTDAVAAEMTRLSGEFILATGIANAILWLALGLTSVWAVRKLVTPVNVQHSA